MSIVRTADRTAPSASGREAPGDIVFVLDVTGRVKAATDAGAALVYMTRVGLPVWELPGFARHQRAAAWLQACVENASASASPHVIETTVGEHASRCVLSLGCLPSGVGGAPLLLLEARAAVATQTAPEPTAPELSALGAGLALLATGDVDSREVDAAVATTVDAPRAAWSGDAVHFEQNGTMQLLADAESGRILDVNTAAASFYGWPRETMQSMMLLDLDATAVAEWRTLAQAIVAGASRRVPLQHRVASGAVQSVDAYGRRLTLHGSPALHIFVRDASERLRAERLMRESEEGSRLIRKLQAVCELAANTAHEFNSLLMVIAGSAGFLRQDLAGRGRELEDVSSIERASKRAEELTRQLLTTVRAELPRLRTVDLSGQLQNALPAIRERMGSQIQVVLLPSAAPVLARLEEAALPDVFWTLLDHLRLGLSGRGVLSVSTDLVERDEGGGLVPYAVLCVSDVGRAVQATSRAQLLEALQSAFVSRAGGPASPGSGGFVSLRDDAGGGTGVLLHFPAAQTMPTPPVAATPVARAARVVLVSREPLFRDITRRMLQKLELEVVMVESGEEALVALDADKDAAWDVVTDLNVRGTSGIALIDALRTRTSSVVLLAGADIESGVRRALETRAVQRLDKPFTMVELDLALRAARACAAGATGS